MKTIESLITTDFLEKLGVTETISKYSPTADSIARKCSKVYSSSEHGVYSIKETDVIAGAKERGFQIKNNGKLTQINVSATEFGKIGDRVFSDSLICQHGMAPYTLAVNSVTLQPDVKPICSKCSGGFQAPDSEEIKRAEQAIMAGYKNLKKPIALGVLIIAFRNLGYVAEKPSSNLTTITRKKENPV